jgi:hypothetical protein
MAVIAQARIAAAHEGHAELVIALRFSNGGTSNVVLDAAAAAALMQACEASTLEQLEGQSWKKVQDALIQSHKR